MKSTRPPRPWPILRLQTTLGNRAVTGSLFPRQPAAPVEALPEPPKPNRPWLPPPVFGGMSGLATGFLLLLYPRLALYTVPAIACLAGVLAGVAFSLAKKARR